MTDHETATARLVDAGLTPDAAATIVAELLPPAMSDEEPDPPEKPRGNYVPREGHAAIHPPNRADIEMREFARELFQRDP